MAKYSANWGGGGGNGDSYELYGRGTVKLRHVNMAGVDLLTCPDCTPYSKNCHTDRKSGSGDTPCDGSSGSHKKRVAQRTAKLYDSVKGDSKHWEEKGTNHEKDWLPYLVSGCSDVVKPARQDVGLQLAELANELDLDEKQPLATEQGRAARVNIGGSAIRALEERLDATLVGE